MKGAGRRAIAADTVFDGTVLHSDHAVILDGNAIRGLVPTRDLPRGLPVRRLPDGAWLAPGFIDVQVNGGGDVLFNDTPTVEGIAAIVAAHRRFGLKPPPLLCPGFSAFISRDRSCRPSGPGCTTRRCSERRRRRIRNF